MTRPNRLSLQMVWNKGPTTSGNPSKTCEREGGQKGGEKIVRRIGLGSVEYFKKSGISHSKEDCIMRGKSALPGATHRKWAWKKVANS